MLFPPSPGICVVPGAGVQPQRTTCVAQVLGPDAAEVRLLGHALYRWEVTVKAKAVKRRCKACGGSGRASKGGRCQPCNGMGFTKRG